MDKKSPRKEPGSPLKVPHSKHHAKPDGFQATPGFGDLNVKPQEPAEIRPKDSHPGGHQHRHH